QALLYTVALHRYLRWRVTGYDPGEHIGGVLYLYVRGMAGPETPVIDGHAAGVYFWVPPPGLVTELSDLLDGAAPREGQGRWTSTTPMSNTPTVPTAPTGSSR